MKQWKWICSILMAMLLSAPAMCVHASGSEVAIEIKATSVARIYYEVLDHGTRIEQEVEFTLLDSNGRECRTIKTETGILDEKNVPFGTYTLALKDGKKEIKLVINSEYLETQNTLKPLEIGLEKESTLGPGLQTPEKAPSAIGVSTDVPTERSPVKTGDPAQTIRLAIVAGIALLAMIISWGYKKRRERK